MSATIVCVAVPLDGRFFQAGGTRLLSALFVCARATVVNVWWGALSCFVPSRRVHDEAVLGSLHGHEGALSTRVPVRGHDGMSLSALDTRCLDTGQSELSFPSCLLSRSRLVCCPALDEDRSAYVVDSLWFG